VEAQFGLPPQEKAQHHGPEVSKNKNTQTQPNFCRYPERAIHFTILFGLFFVFGRLGLCCPFGIFLF
jgi:hypothetical protein